MHRQRLSGPLQSCTEQPQRPSPPPEPPPWGASGSSDHHSCCNDNDSCSIEQSSSWSEEYSCYSGGPCSDGSWEDDSFCNSYTRSYGNGKGDSGYGNISTKQSVRAYKVHEPCVSDEDSDSREDPREGEPPSKFSEGGTIPPPPCLSCPLSNGSITALWGPRTSVRWHQQMQSAAVETNSLFYSWVPSISPVHATTSRCGQGNITPGSAPQKKRTFYGRSQVLASRAQYRPRRPTSNEEVSKAKVM